MENLKQSLVEFVQRREWQQYHSPKNLATSLAIEAAELLEIFLWLDNDESYNLTSDQVSKLSDEIGDVLINLVNLSSKFDLDPIDCAEKKLKMLAIKYPEDRSRGNARKYNEF